MEERGSLTSLFFPTGDFDPVPAPLGRDGVPRAFLLISLSVLDLGNPTDAPVGSANVGIGGLTGPMRRGCAIGGALELRLEPDGSGSDLSVETRFAVGGVCTVSWLLSRFAVVDEVVRKGCLT